MPRKLFSALLLCLALAEAAIVWSSLHKRSSALPIAEPEKDSLAAQALAIPVVPARTVFVEPDAGFAWLYARVNAAQKTIDMVMYELADTAMTADLVQACARGVKVRVLLDGRFERNSNTPAFNQLSAAGPNCTVAWSQPRFPATHQKSIVLDGSTAVIMSLNLTSRYYASTRDLAILDTDRSDIVAIEATLFQDLKPEQDKEFTEIMGHSLIWSPTTSQDDLVSMIQGAKTTLLVENEELSARSIVDALTDACKRGVKVTLAMTDTSAAYHANFSALQAAGCGVHVGANDEKILYIHAKAMVADLGTTGALGYVGSINFSDASLNRNRELGLYVHDPGALGQIAAAITSDYNAFPAFNGATRLPNTRPALP